MLKRMMPVGIQETERKLLRMELRTKLRSLIAEAFFSVVVNLSVSVNLDWFNVCLAAF